MRRASTKWKLWPSIPVLVLAGLLTSPLFTSIPANAVGSSDATTTSTTSTTTTTVPTGTTTTTEPTTTTTAPTGTTTTTTLPAVRKQTNLVWPKMGSAALAIPQLGVAAISPRQQAQPIASLTKMMTVWIVLQEFPLGNSQLGACETVTASDVALYKQDVAQQQSVAKIVKGQYICERTLLRGIFVHSAGDYAQLLVEFTGMSFPSFVDLMNREAAALGMSHTHYVDVTGISTGDVSTAQDQSVLAVDLMTTESIVRSVAALTKVWLPAEGVVGTYTPDLGHNGVVGVKSGYTGEAGGCDVMAVNLVLNKTVVTTYVVVLGQQSNNALVLSGQVALALYRSLRPSIARVVTSTGVQVQWIGSLSDVAAAGSST